MTCGYWCQHQVEVDALTLEAEEQPNQLVLNRMQCCIVFPVTASECDCGPTVLLDRPDKISFTRSNKRNACNYDVLHDAKQADVAVHAASRAAYSTNTTQKSELVGRCNGKRLHGVLVFPHGRII